MHEPSTGQQDSEFVIQLHQVTKRFKNQVALDRVSLEVKSGQVFALLGENGAGKTTAIQILLGLLTADGGSASLLGLDSRTSGREIRRRVGYVAERPALYEWMTVDEIGWFAAGFYPEGFLLRYRNLIAEFELTEAARIGTLSKGMQAKVGLALALAHDPQVLILDEPTSGLDAVVRREFLERMVDLAAEGKTVFLSSHQIAEVERVADTVAFIKQGQLGSIEHVEAVKRLTREVIVTLGSDDDEVDAPWDLLYQARRGRQLQWIVKEWDESLLGKLQASEQVTSVETRPLSLEEVFVARMRGGNFSRESARQDVPDSIERATP